MPKLKAELRAELIFDVKPEWLQRKDPVQGKEITLSLQEFMKEQAEFYKEDFLFLLENDNTQLTITVTPVEE